MSIKLEPSNPGPQQHHPVITIIGAGGAGGNAINNMIRNQVRSVNFVACNTDAQALGVSMAPHRLQIGMETTRGLGAGSNPELGAAAAEENIDEIRSCLEKSQMLFLTAGMGGGTGTGASPVIARLAREMGILTVAIVTRPFNFEGKRRMEVAEKGIEKLIPHVDTLIVIPNQNLFRIADQNTTFPAAFKMADDVLCSGIRGITDLMTMPGVINLDFADICNLMRVRGKAMIGTGEAEGDERARKAARAAIANPLLDDGLSVRTAHGMLVNIIGGADLTLHEVEEAVNCVREATEADTELPLTFGTSLDDTMHGRVRISILATGIDRDNEESHYGPLEPTGFPNKLPPNLSVKPAPTKGAASPAYDPAHVDRILSPTEQKREEERASDNNVQNGQYHGQTPDTTPVQQAPIAPPPAQAAPPPVQPTEPAPAEPILNGHAGQEPPAGHAEQQLPAGHAEQQPKESLFNKILEKARPPKGAKKLFPRVETLELPLDAPPSSPADPDPQELDYGYKRENENRDNVDIPSFLRNQGN